MLVNLSSYGLGYPRPYGDRVTNMRGCLYEGDSLKNHYPRGDGVLIRGVRSFERGAHSRKCGMCFLYHLCERYCFK